VLDLDRVAWLPGDEPLRRPLEASAAELHDFCQRHAHWVVEGCYASLIAMVLQYRPTLIFLNPGLEACEAHCRARPWEPHKYSTRAEQDARLEALLDWVRGYGHRDGEFSLAGHRAVFDRYDGPRLECNNPLVYQTPSAELLAVSGLC